MNLIQNKNINDTEHVQSQGKACTHIPRSTNKLVLVFSVIAFLLSGCTTTIIPPRLQDQTTSVAIIDYGYHAGLVLPDGFNGAVEYEYGEWRWFALGQSGSPQLIPTLFWPTQGALGRRILSTPSDLERKEEIHEILILHVSVEAADHLRKRLNARYQANIATEVENKEAEMTFVKDPAPYSIVHNCNHRLALWLRELGCEIPGNATFARFRIREDKR